MADARGLGKGNGSYSLNCEQAFSPSVMSSAVETSRIDKDPIPGRSETLRLRSEGFGGASSARPTGGGAMTGWEVVLSLAERARGGKLGALCEDARSTEPQKRGAVHYFLGRVVVCRGGAGVYEMQNIVHTFSYCVDIGIWSIYHIRK